MKCGPNSLMRSACTRKVSGACASGNCAYGTSPAAIRVAMFRMYEMSTSTATWVFRHTVNAALAAKRSSGRSGRERPGSAARPAPITRREYRCEMRKGNDMRWLLLGATGLVGTHLRAALRGRDVVTTSHRAQLPGALAVDLTDRAATTRLIREVRSDVIVVAAINEYGRQKVAVEAIARERSDHLVCRVSGVYGWSSARTSFVCQLIDRLRAGRSLRVPSDQIITPTPAADLAGVIVELVDRSARGIFHAAGPEILPRPEFARRAAEAFGLDPALLDLRTTAELGLAAPRPLRAGLVTDKLRVFLGHGLSPSRDALAAMRDT